MIELTEGIWAIVPRERLTQQAAEELGAQAIAAAPERRFLIFRDPVDLISLNGLDAAWAAAEKMLPEGWTLEVGTWQAEPNRPEGLAKYEATAEPYGFEEQERQGRVIGRGETAAAAVRQVVEGLARR